jgi:hypothetical protein
MADDCVFLYLCLLALEEIEEGGAGRPVTILIESKDHAALNYLRTLLQSAGKTPLVCVVEQLRTKTPTIDYMFGPHLEDCIKNLIPILFEIKPVTKAVLHVEHLTPENPIRVEAYPEDTVVIAIPLKDFMEPTISKHYFELAAYGQALRFARRAGRPPKTPDAPTTRADRDTDEEAIRAWTMRQQGVARLTIARTLFPEAPATKQIMGKVDRRISRGRQLARDPSSSRKQKKMRSHSKNRHGKNPT